MEKRPSIEEKVTDDKLHQQYKHLQQEWDSIKQSNPRILRRSSTDSSINTLQLLDNSPRNLMTSLQHKWSPLEGAWKVRNNDLAVEEILRERRAAIESGKLKGRRLFDAVEGVTEVGFGRREEISSDCWHGLVQESEVRSVFSYDSDDENEKSRSNERLFPVCCQCCSCSSTSSTSLCGENVEKEVKEEERVVAIVEEKKVACGGERRRWILVVMVWLTIAIIVSAVSIISMKSLGGYVDEKIILVPT